MTKSKYIIEQLEKDILRQLFAEDEELMQPTISMESRAATDEKSIVEECIESGIERAATTTFIRSNL